MLNLHKTDGVIPKEDQEKLLRLNREREECLRPVKIRITSYDRMSPLMRMRSQTGNGLEEEEIPIDALETLEMLKAQRGKSSPSSDEGDDELNIDSDLDELNDERMNSDDDSNLGSSKGKCREDQDAEDGASSSLFDLSRPKEERSEEASSSTSTASSATPSAMEEEEEERIADGSCVPSSSTSC